MDKELLLSPKFSKNLPRDDILEDQSFTTQENIFNIDVNSFILAEKNSTVEPEDLLDSKNLISTSYSDGGNIFYKEEISEKLINLYNQDRKLECPSAM